MKVTLVVLVVLLLTAALGFGQLQQDHVIDMPAPIIAAPVVPPNPANAGASPTFHQHGAGPQIIDGKLHPELIADLTAYKMFFLTSGQLPTAPKTELTRQAGIVLYKLQFKGDDTKTYIQLANEFRAKYEDIVSAHNQLAEAAFAVGSKPANDDVDGKLNKLTADTVAKMQKALTGDASKQLQSVIVGEKQYIKIMPAAAQTAAQ